MVSVTMVMTAAFALTVSIQTIITQSTKDENKKRVCEYLGAEFQVGDLVTGNKCDRCYCTQYGIMCEMIKCDITQCYDKVMGKCCYECPNGRNCLYEGENGTVIVPETGCLYSDDVVCSCYYDNEAIDGETKCGPGNDAPLCQAFLP